MWKTFRNYAKQFSISAMRLSTLRRATRFMAAALNCYQMQCALKLAQELCVHSNGAIMDGPFRGLRYSPDAIQDLEFAKKILGTYENELHPTLEIILSNQYDLIVDIGAAEGYYLIGLGRKFPGSRIVGFEAVDTRRQIAEKNIQWNQMGERIEMKGFCNLESLKELLSEADHPLILIDCEGYELTLMQPNSIPALSRSDILMELHELEQQGTTISEIMTNRFKSTHKPSFINVRPEKRVEHPLLEQKDPGIVSRIVNEGRRYSTGWVLLTSQLHEPNRSS